MRVLSGVARRVPLTEDPYSSLAKARGYDHAAARNSLLYPMERVVSLVEPWCRPGMRLLNVGSATGVLALMLGGRRPDVEIAGVEEHEFFRSVSEENAALAYLSRSPARVDFQPGDLAALPLDDASADVVFANNVLYRCSEPVEVLRECARVCRPEGLVLLYELARDADADKVRFVVQYLRHFGKDEFLQTLRACYTRAELRGLLERAGLGHWSTIPEQLSVRIASRALAPFQPVVE